MPRMRYGQWFGQLGLYGVTLAAVLVIVFLLPRAMPGDPLLRLLDNGGDSPLSEEMRATLARYYGLDRSLWEQGLGYLANLARGDLGWSISLNAPVGTLIAAHLPWTLGLMVPAILLATLISLFAGAHSGWVRNSPADRSLLIAFTLLDTLPAFLFGALLLLFFSARLGWLPLAGARTAFATYHSPWERLADILAHLVLPLATLTLTMAGRDYLLMRNSMVTILGADFMVVVRGKGLPISTQKYRHGMRNALLPVVTRLSMQMGASIGGSVLIETLFAYPGMGRLMFNAVAARDYPLLNGCFLVSSLVVLLANLAADLSYAWLDPRTGRGA